MLFCPVISKYSMKLQEKQIPTVGYTVGRGYRTLFYCSRCLHSGRFPSCLPGWRKKSRLAPNALLVHTSDEVGESITDDVW